MIAIINRQNVECMFFSQYKVKSPPLSAKMEYLAFQLPLGQALPGSWRAWGLRFREPAPYQVLLAERKKLFGLSGALVAVPLGNKMHPSVSWLAGGRAWLGGLKGCGPPVSHQVDHVSAVAAEGPTFSLGHPGNRISWVEKGGECCQPCGPLEC
ncbi:hypothetical protein HPG69_009076 [Diceros bicornis minor]|uniref:Uncharacterized protein n=1 Tax=Diceros bicornis minor TaxID=77932 RepID=A0A7J7EBE0_DICBM|nr:hypothetical protein HPG69_009076 [Diceros bicornis minor]